MTPVCTVPGCDLPCNARGWCSTHYHRWRRHGDPLAVFRDGIPARPRPLPFAPVDTWARYNEVSRDALALRLRPDSALRTAWRWVDRARESGLSVWEADRVAIALGLHPVELWPDFHTVKAEYDATDLMFQRLRAGVRV